MTVKLKAEKKLRGPMVAKLRVKEVIIDRLKENEQEFISKLKALVAILKSPSKYQQFTKTLA